MKKIDLKKELKHLYGPSSREVVAVDVPAMNFLMIDGKGNPNTSEDYRQALEALYGLSFTLKFMLKKGKNPVDYGVMPLEGLWWSDSMDNFLLGKRDEWKWTSMIMQPRYVTKNLFELACEEVKEKKNPAALSRIRFEAYAEGMSAQIMHIGPYSAEAPIIQKIHHFIFDGGHSLHGRHHEIYLGDPRKSAPEKLKTVIRQPFR